MGDPLVDWLDLYGERRHYQRDGASAYDFPEFILAQGQRFEAAVVELIRRLGFDLAEIQRPDRRGPSIESLEATFRAMRDGREIIMQGQVADPVSGTYGHPDMLVRSDVVNRLVAGTFEDPSETAMSAPALGGEFHYVVVDIKFSGLHFSRAWELGNEGSVAAFKAQLHVYNRGLTYMQGFEPRRTFLLGRSAQREYSDKNQGGRVVEPLNRSCLDRLGSVLTGDTTVASAVERAIAWRRRLRAEGANWVAEPSPSVAELRPDMKNVDAGWKSARKRIARATGELTQLWQVGPAKRDAALAGGVARNDQPELTAAQLGVKGAKVGPRLDALLTIERDPYRVVLPDKIRWNESEWREPGPLEFFVDFETVSGLDDDFAALPKRGGCPMIFQIGCLHFEGGAPVFAQFTVSRLVVGEERRIVEEWIEHMEAARRLLAPKLERPVAWHWAPAEVSSIETSIESYRAHFPDGPTPRVKFRDALAVIMKPSGPEGGTVAVKGAGAFGLKAVAKALHGQGLIATHWQDGPADGLGAMVGAWLADRESRATGADLRAHPVLRDIGRYNEIDCRAMRDVIDYLRRNH